MNIQRTALRSIELSCNVCTPDRTPMQSNYITNEQNTEYFSSRHVLLLIEVYTDNVLQHVSFPMNAQLPDNKGLRASV